MKKIIYILFIFLSTTLLSYANYTPSYVNSHIYYGEGLITSNQAIRVYSDSNTESKVVAILDKDYITLDGGYNPSVEETYIAYSKERKLALLPVEKDTDEWYYICYNQRKKLFGWVKKSEETDYISWQELFNVYGRKLGVYFFRNVKDKYKKLYSSPDVKSTVVDDFYFAKHVALWLIANDWMLVKVTTYDGLTKTGWMRWRTENGSIIAFPDFRDGDI